MIELEDSHISLKKQSGEFFDWTTFLISIMLTAAGLISIYSATYDSGSSTFFYRQLLYTGLGFGLMFLIMYLPEGWIRVNSYTVYLVCNVLLILVIFVGKETYGTKGWIEIFGFTLQPSELAKLGTLLVIAQHLSRPGNDIRNLRDLLFIMMVVIVPVGLIFLEPDIGSGLVFFAMLLGILFWAGFDLFTLFVIVSTPIIIILSFIGLPFYIGSVILYSVTAFLFRKSKGLIIGSIILISGIGYASPLIIDNLMPHQKARIDTFLNPGKDPKGKGYNVIQSILAVGSGGITGKGFLQGTQTQLRYIPKQWTDFIFCVPTEEFGFIGGITVIGLLAALISRAVTIAKETSSIFLSIIAAGAASLFFFHSLINIGMAIGMLPVMGIPLPFMSAGGSSLILNMSLVGLLLNTYRNNKLKKKISH